MLSHEKARAFYDWFGAKQDWQRFYEDPAVDSLVRHLSLESAKSVIEFGCGTGRLAGSFLANHLPADAEYLGLDVSPVMVRLTEGRLARFGDRARVLLTTGETTLPVASGSFDRFISIYVLDLLTEDEVRSLVAEAHRVLAPGGLLGLVSLTHGFTPLSRVVEKVWVTLHRANPAIVGGCRPISLQKFVKDAWAIRHAQKIARFGVPSEVLVAEKV
jgi:ubiquinone/menaquinone biosynthesis C-methylase UbiE